MSKISAPRSNREFVEACIKSGDAVRIKQEVDWDHEAGAIVRRVCELGQSAPFMEKIKDYPGFSYFGAPLSTYRRMAIALGFNYALMSNVVFKAEYRLDLASQAVFLDTKSGNFKKNNSLLGATLVTSF